VRARAETGKAPFLVSLVDSHKAFSKKPIRAIEVLEDLKLMLSLTGNWSLLVLSTHHLPIAQAVGASMRC
jgi:hypothetical protein